MICPHCGRELRGSRFTSALTASQLAILNIIRGWMKTHEYAPSYREIAKLAGLSSLATIHKHIEILEVKGYIRTAISSKRSIQLLRRT